MHRARRCRPGQFWSTNCDASCLEPPARRPCDPATLPRVLAAATSLAMGEVEGQQGLREGAVGGRFVSGWVVGADAGGDRLDDDIVVRPEEERAGVTRAIVAIDDPV